jgi:hypothetical protein
VTAPIRDEHRRTSFTLWESPHAREIVARLAIAGDFLPAGKLNLPADGNWRGVAQSLAPHYEDVAISCVNLESILDAHDLAARPLCGLGNIVSAPSVCLNYLEAIRAQFVGIANNHAYDFGSGGIARTREAISQRGMTPLGAGYDLLAEPEVAIWQGPGPIRVGFWAAARATSDPATRDKAGVEPATAARALRALNLIKHLGPTVCIALLHSGCLRTSYPDPEDLRLIDHIAELGFDVVAASHSHRISGAKHVRARNGRDSFCFYGLGSVVSGYVAHPSEREGLIVIVGIDFEGRLSQIEVRPVLIAENGFGEIPSQADSQTILQRFSHISAEIEDGSYERAFYRDVSNGLVRLYLRDARRAFQQLGMRGLARKASRVRIRHMKRLVHKVTG